MCTLTVKFSACYPSGKTDCPQFTLGTAVTDSKGYFRFKVKKASTDRYWVLIDCNTCSQGFSFENIPEKELTSAYTTIYLYKK